MRSGMPILLTTGASPILPEIMRTSEPPSMFSTTPRSQLRNSCDSFRVTVGAVHPVEENRQFVDYKENRLVMLGAIADQPFPVTPASFRHSIRPGS